MSILKTIHVVEQKKEVKTFTLCFYFNNQYQFLEIKNNDTPQKIAEGLHQLANAIYNIQCEHEFVSFGHDSLSSCGAIVCRKCGYIPDNVA